MNQRTLKAVIALLLCVALMCTLFAACNKKSETPSNNTPSNSTPSNTTPDKTDEGEKPAETTEPETFDEEPTDIIFYMWDMRGTGNDYGDAAKQAAHDYVLEKINVDVDINFVNMGDWTTKVAVALSSGERMDVATLFGGLRIAAAYPNNQLMDITDLLPVYAPEALEACKDYIGTYTYNGRTFGLPTLRNYSKNGYILFNGEILNELGLTEQARAIKSWSDYEAVMKAFKEQYGDANGIYATRGKTGDWICNNYVSTGDSFDSFVLFDNLGDGSSVVFTDMDGHVSLYQDQPGWVNEASIMADWMNKGYVWPDSPFTTEFGDDNMKQKIIFSIVTGSEYGVEVTKTNTYGFECVAVETVTGMIKTSQPVFAGIGVPYTAEEPEAACKFINLLYSDATLMNYLTWGVEGKDYELVDGQVKYGDDPKHYLGVDFILGNNLLLTPLYGNGVDFYDKVREINANALKSPYMGFSLNLTDLDGVISQISAVNDQYLGNMQGGGYTEELYNEYLNKLQSADVQSYLDNVQGQLDAWLANH